MRKLTKDEFIEFVLHDKYELYGLSDDECNLYYHFYLMGRQSVRA